MAFDTVASRLSSIGFTVLACVRRWEDGKHFEGDSNIHLAVLDVTNETHVSELRRRVEEYALPLVALVDNAGVQGDGFPVESTSIDNMRMVLEVNVVGPVRMVQTFLPFIRAAKGRVINIGSVDGYLALDLMSTYAASKHAKDAVADSLRREMIPLGVHVSIIEPGWTHMRYMYILYYIYNIYNIYNIYIYIYI